MVNATDPAELEKIKDRELGIARERVQMVLDAGANVILTTKVGVRVSLRVVLQLTCDVESNDAQGIDDTVLKYFVDRGAMGVRRCKKEDLKRIARVTGAQLVSTLADMDGNESFDASMLGCVAGSALMVGDIVMAALSTNMLNMLLGVSLCKDG